MVYIVTDREQVVVGIDAGGSATRAPARANDLVVFEGRGGPGNPLAAGADVLASSYRAALAGCPDPAQVAACVSGTGGSQQRAQVSRLLTERFPASAVQVVPDHVGALVAAPAGTDIVVIAGTGSVVCSAASGGEYRVSGGRGWILGDRCSAARLGQAALEWSSEDDRDPEVSAHVRDCLGLSDWRQIASALSASTSPSALLAKAAPVLTRAAESGSEWAVQRLNAEMAALAATTVRHVEQHVRPVGQLRVALAGGVWRSRAARTAFAAALQESLELAPAHLDKPLDPLDGAASLAMRMDGSID